MKNTDLQKNEKGQTLLEIIAVLVIIGTILAAVIPAVSASTDNGRINSTLSAVRNIQSSAVSYYNDNNGTFGSISNTGLIPKYIPGPATGAITDAWGGSISVGPGTITSQYVITLNSVPLSVEGTLVTDLTNTSISTSYSKTTNALQVTMS